MTTQVDHVPPSEDYVFPMFNGATGEYIYGVPAPNSLRIRRKAFVKMLGEGIDVEVCTNSLLSIFLLLPQ